MALVPLSPSQETAVAKLVAGRRIEGVPADVKRAAIFIARAQAALDDAEQLIHAHTIHNVAYDACHDVGEALLAAYGYRTLATVGQHEALGRFLTIVLDAPPGKAAAVKFDQLRKSRNRNRYEAVPVGMPQAEAAKTAARELIEGAKARGVKP